MIFNSYCEFLGTEQRAYASDLLPAAPMPQMSGQSLGRATLHNLTQLIYDVL